MEGTLEKLINSVHGTKGYEQLVERLLLEHMKDFVIGLNQQYINEKLIPDSGVVYYVPAHNRLQIGKNTEPCWTMTFHKTIKEAIELFDANKQKIADETRHWANVYHKNILQAVSESVVFLHDMESDKELIQLAEKNYFDFKKLSIKREYHIDYGTLDTKVLYDGSQLGNVLHRLYLPPDPSTIKQFNDIRLKIDEKFIKKTIDSVIAETRRTGSLSRQDQTMLVNWAIDRQDHLLGKLLHGKRRKLYKEDREKLDSFMLSCKLAGL